MSQTSGDEELERRPNCLARSAGCLVSAVLFVPCWVISGWLAFALGMSCAFPQRCSAFEKWLKGGVGLVVFFGGGVGLPIGAGLVTHRLLKQ